MDSLDQVALLFGRHSGKAETAVIGSAHARAAALRSRLRGTREAEQLAVTLLVARGLSGLWAPQRWTSASVGELLENAARIAEIPVDSFSLSVSQYILCDPALLELPPPLAIQAQMDLLCALARLAHVSLWLRDPDGRLRCPEHAGPGGPSRRARELAKAAMEGHETQPGGRRRLFGMAVMRWERPHAALVGSVSPGDQGRGIEFVDQAAAMIGPILERLSLLERNAARERSLVEATERRLTRLGLDLHDQPLQEVAALANDMRAFRRQIGQSNGSRDHREILVGRVHDLEARLAALDDGLRALCNTLEPPALLARPLPELLQREIDAHMARTEMTVSLRLECECEKLSDSQRIALARVVQECLSNAREHSGADQIQVDVCSTDAYIDASVTDNGRGFEVESTLLEAARRGRLGLVGIHERVRLLGGRCEVRSRPGGPTSVSIRLSQWHRPPATSEMVAVAS